MPSYPSWEEMRRRKGRGESVQKGREENGRRMVGDRGEEMGQEMTRLGKG